MMISIKFVRLYGQGRQEALSPAWPDAPRQFIIFKEKERSL